MEPYVIREGDTLAKLARRFGFDADTVWKDPKNADLRKVRSDPNILWPTDILYIPDEVGRESAMHPLITGTTNSFTSEVPMIPLIVQFSDTRLASQPYTIAELDQLTGLTTDASGLLTATVPVDLHAATITFPTIAFTCSLRIGWLDPVNTLSGAYQRLRNLGYIDDAFDSATPEVVRSALAALKQDRGTASDAAPAAFPADSGSTGSTSDDASDIESRDDPTTAVSNNGLNDDGSLDAETSMLLGTTHGC